MLWQAAVSFMSVSHKLEHRPKHQISGQINFFRRSHVSLRRQTVQTMRKIELTVWPWIFLAVQEQNGDVMSVLENTLSTSLLSLSMIQDILK